MNAPVAVAARKKSERSTPTNSPGEIRAANNEYSVFYDPRFTMQITVNGQLMLAQLCEWLLSVPTVRLLQANTEKNS